MLSYKIRVLVSSRGTGIDMTDKIIIALGTIIQTKRKQLGLTQNEFSKLTGFHRSYISDIENGMRNVALVNLYKIAEGLRVDGSNLLITAEGMIK